MCSLSQLLTPVRRQRRAQHLLYVCMLAVLTADVRVSDPMSGLVKASLGAKIMWRITRKSCAVSSNNSSARTHFCNTMEVCEFKFGSAVSGLKRENWNVSTIHERHSAIAFQHRDKIGLLMSA